MPPAHETDADEPVGPLGILKIKRTLSEFEWAYFENEDHPREVEYHFPNPSNEWRMSGLLSFLNFHVMVETYETKMQSDMIFGKGWKDTMPFHFGIDRIRVESSETKQDWNFETGADVHLIDWLKADGQTWHVEPDQGKQQFDLRVTDLMGGDRRVYADGTDKVLLIKKAICIMSGGAIPVESQTLTTHAGVLTDSSTLTEQRVTASSILSMGLKIRAGNNITARFATLAEMLSPQTNPTRNAKYYYPVFQMIEPCGLLDVLGNFVGIVPITSMTTFLKAQSETAYSWATSDIARLARLLWKDEEAAKEKGRRNAAHMIGRIWGTIVQLLRTPGRDWDERFANFFENSGLVLKNESGSS